MAKIFVKGTYEPILVENNQATKIQELWIKKQLPDIVKAGTDTFKSSEIKRIELDNEIKFEETSISREMAYLTSDILKTILKDFRINWKKHNFGKYIQNDCLGVEKEGIIAWLTQEEIIHERIEDKTSYWEIKNEAIFNEFNRQKAAMSELDYRQERAKEEEQIVLSISLGETIVPKTALSQIIRGLKDFIDEKPESSNAKAVLKKYEKLNNYA